MDGQEVIESLQERITGRTLAEDIIDPVTGEIVGHANELMYSP